MPFMEIFTAQIKLPNKLLFNNQVEIKNTTLKAPHQLMMSHEKKTFVNDDTNCNY